MPHAVLLGYDLTQPSFRHRMQTLIGALESAGWEVRAELFPSGRYGLRTWERRRLLAWADVSVLHQIKLSALEARLFASLSRHRVFDLDDAIYVRKPRRLGEVADDSIWRRRKFRATCRYVDVVAAGNDILAGAARASAKRTAILPTSIDTGASRRRSATHGAKPAPTLGRRIGVTIPSTPTRSATGRAGGAGRETGSGTGAGSGGGGSGGVAGSGGGSDGGSDLGKGPAEGAMVMPTLTRRLEFARAT